MLCQACSFSVLTIYFLSNKKLSLVASVVEWSKNEEKEEILKRPISTRNTKDLNDAGDKLP